MHYSLHPEISGDQRYQLVSGNRTIGHFLLFNLGTLVHQIPILIAFLNGWGQIKVLGWSKIWKFCENNENSSWSHFKIEGQKYKWRVLSLGGRSIFAWRRGGAELVKVDDGIPQG